MKATIETFEPTIRPVATTRRINTTRATRSFAALTPVRSDAVLFHAWRA